MLIFGGWGKPPSSSGRSLLPQGRLFYPLSENDQFILDFLNFRLYFLIMPFLRFLLEAVVISLSGVMAPGPLTAITIGKGTESPHAGAMIAMGHGMVEFPLMILIFLGLGSLLNLPYVRIGIGLAGGLFLLLMGIDMLRGLKTVNVGSNRYVRSPLFAGVLLSAGNPFFLLWWATIGAALILRSVNFGILGFAIFALVHWSCDLIWCYTLSTLSFKGGQFFGGRLQQVIFGICGVLLLFFSSKFIINALRLING